MPTWAIVIIVFGALVGTAAIVLAMRARNEQLDRQRAEANELRQEADQRYAAAKESGAAAEEEAQYAHRERAAATMTARRADEIDPDVDS